MSEAQISQVLDFAEFLKQKGSAKAEDHKLTEDRSTPSPSSRNSSVVLGEPEGGVHRKRSIAAKISSTERVSLDCCQFRNLLSTTSAIKDLMSSTVMSTIFAATML
jgi:hypothetical protein